MFGKVENIRNMMKTKGVFRVLSKREIVTVFCRQEISIVGSLNVPRRIRTESLETRRKIENAMPIILMRQIRRLEILGKFRAIEYQEYGLLYSLGNKERVSIPGIVEVSVISTKLAIVGQGVIMRRMGRF